MIHLGAAGQTLWARRFGSDGNESGLAIARDPSGDVLVAGTTDGGYGGPVGVPGIHSFVTRFDANGNELWVARLEVTTFGPGHRRYVEGLAGDGAGRWTVTGWQTRPNDAFSGSFMAKVDGQGAVVDEGIHSIYCAHFHGSAPDGQGGDVVAATSYNGCAQASRYVFRVDSAGMVVWSTSLCSACTGYGVASDISADGAGGYFVSGTSADTSRPGVVHLDSQGVVDWRWSPPNSAHGILEGLSEVRGGSIFAAGTLAASTHRVLRIAIDPAGPTVCDGVPNSTGSAATAGYVGQEDRALNDVVFYANGLPAHAAGYFIVSQTAGNLPMAGGSQGTLCLGGSIGRLNRPGEVLSSSVDGRFHVAFDLDSIPQPLGTISATAGETWSFQAWYRDANPGSTSNFTSATSIVLH